MGERNDNEEKKDSSSRATNRFGKTGAASRNWRAVRPDWWDYEPGMRWRIDLGTGVTIENVDAIKSQFNKEKWLPLCQMIPALISHRCCGVMKKSPMHKYQTKHGYKPILATLAEESRIRKQGWIRHGCNAYEGNIMSQPMSFWTEQDVLAYIVLHDLKIASVYGEIVSEDKKGNQYPPIDLTGECRSGLKCTGCQRTGCIFCAFGFHSERSGETRFQRLARTHPRQYEYCIKGGKWSDNPYYDPTAPKMDGDWENWNPKKIWVPSEKGMGMGQLFDMVNEIYGKDFYRYE